MHKAIVYWVLAAILTLCLGAIATFILPASGVTGALFGSTVGAVLSATISTALQIKKQQQQDSQNQQLRERALTEEAYRKLREQLPRLEARVQSLQEERSNLAGYEGQATQKQEECTVLQERINSLKQQQQQLENRIATINQQNPMRENREQLQQNIEELEVKSNSLLGQINGFQSELERLEKQKQELLNIEQQFPAKKERLEALKQELQQSEARALSLANKSAELELLRAIYDELYSERQSLEQRVNQLKPEIARLETEKQRIETEIEKQEDKYANSLRIQEEINKLNRELGTLKQKNREQEIENDRLKDEEIYYNRRLNELKEEIRKTENIAGDTNRRVEAALEALKLSPWSQSQLATLRQTTIPNEQEFIKGFTNYIRARGLEFPERVIRAFHTSCKVQGISALVVLAGISGTGKSELPQLYAQYIGALPLVLAVQPRWDSPQDLLGFYNYMEDKFKPTPLVQGIYQYNQSQQLQQQDRIVIVLLDEMNLARVEYYFSEFLSKLESRRNYEAYLDIDLGSLPVADDKKRFKIPPQFLFVGTMNEDETTQSLSDKVLDRANVITFGRPANLALANNGGQAESLSGYLTYSQFKSWFKSPDSSPSVVEKVTHILNHTNEIMEAMGNPFAHRVYQAITQYVVNYPGVINENSPAFKEAIADAFGQKLLPKLRGLMTEDEAVKNNLRSLNQVIAAIDDYPLTSAFQKACEGYQFQWKGLVYPQSVSV